MKFTINTKEFNNVMSLVKKLAECSANAKVSAHNVCLLKGQPKEKSLKLEFSLNGSFLTYSFDNIKIDTNGSALEVKRSVDFSALSSLKFSGTELTIVLGKNREGNTLEFSSGRMKGKLLLSHPDIEKEVETARPPEDGVELTQTFMVSDFISALSAHTYGVHHNAVSANKRPVRIYNKQINDEGFIFFASKDITIASFFMKPMTTPYKKAFDYYVLPIPFKAILDTLPQNVSPVFHFGISKVFWRISHGQLNIWFPNIVQTTNVGELENYVKQVESEPAFVLKTTSTALHKAIADISPFVKGTALSAKDENPAVILTVEDGTVFLTLETSKAKDVICEIENVIIEDNGISFDDSDILVLDSKFIDECVTALAANKVKTSKEKDKEDTVITLMRWPHLGSSAPLRGKTLCLKQGNNYCWLSRRTITKK